MIAMKNSTSAAQAMGVSLMKYRLMAFVISTINAALGGLLYMLYVRNITTSTSTLLTLATSLNILGRRHHRRGKVALGYGLRHLRLMACSRCF